MQATVMGNSGFYMPSRNFLIFKSKLYCDKILPQNCGNNNTDLKMTHFFSKMAEWKVCTSHTVGYGFVSRQEHTIDHQKKVQTASLHCMHV